MSLALLFSGQGLQQAGMLPWLDTQAEAADLLRQMAARLGSDWRQRLSEPAWAERNDVAQVLVTACGLAAWQVLRARGLPEPVVCAGYSVGEVAAYSAAGVFDARFAAPPCPCPAASAAARGGLCGRAGHRPGRRADGAGTGRCDTPAEAAPG